MVVETQILKDMENTIIVELPSPPQAGRS